MAFRLSHITNEASLQGCSQSDLEALLSSDSEFTIPKTPGGKIDSKKLVSLFLVPEDLPRQIANTLYYVDALATIDGADLLQGQFEERYTDFSFGAASVCPIGCTIKAWLKDSLLVKQVLAENSVENIQATDLFCGQTVEGFKKVSKAQITAIEKAMDRWFIKNRRGTGTEINSFLRNGSRWFVIRRGDAFRRESLINQKTRESEPSFGYKELHDIVIYDPETNELLIHAAGIKVKREYARVFGQVLFGDADFFTPGDSYTLDNLLEQKVEALNYGGIPGLHGARLTRIEYPVDNDQNEVVAHSSDDLFASFAERENTIAPAGVIWDSIKQLTQATIKLEVGEVDGVLIGERSVRICPPNRVLFKRDNASPLIVRFLRQNDYVIERKGDGDAEEAA
jgi:hypothetical protein